MEKSSEVFNILNDHDDNIISERFPTKNSAFQRLNSFAFSKHSTKNEHHHHFAQKTTQQLILVRTRACQWRDAHFNMERSSEVFDVPGIKRS